MYLGSASDHHTRHAENNAPDPCHPANRATALRFFLQLAPSNANAEVYMAFQSRQCRDIKVPYQVPSLAE